MKRQFPGGLRGLHFRICGVHREPTPSWSKSRALQRAFENSHVVGSFTFFEILCLYSVTCGYILSKVDRRGHRC